MSEVLEGSLIKVRRAWLCHVGHWMCRHLLHGHNMRLCPSTWNQVPYETLKRTTRERKYVLDDIYKILAALPTLAEGTDGAQKLQDMASALQHLKTKVLGLTGVLV